MAKTDEVQLQILAGSSGFRSNARVFVASMTQYFGHLRRNPNDAPEKSLNFDEYDFWLGKLNEFNGNYVAAELVKAFISSDEYRQRFAQ